MLEVILQSSWLLMLYSYLNDYPEEGFALLRKMSKSVLGILSLRSHDVDLYLLECIGQLW